MQDPACLLLIPDLQPISIAAAAAGDDQALAYLRLTAQQHADCPHACDLSSLDNVCLEASKINDQKANDDFLSALAQDSPKLFSIFDARQTYTSELLTRAASAGELAAIIWMRAVCPQTYNLRMLDLVITAAFGGHTHILKYLLPRPHPELPNPLAACAARHLDCLEWVLSPDAPGGPYPCTVRLLCYAAGLHGLPALQWACNQGHISDDVWSWELLRKAAQMGDQPMLECSGQRIPLCLGILRYVWQQQSGVTSPCWPGLEVNTLHARGTRESLPRQPAGILTLCNGSGPNSLPAPGMKAVGQLQPKAASWKS